MQEEEQSSTWCFTEDRDVIDEEEEYWLQYDLAMKFAEEEELEFFYGVG